MNTANQSEHDSWKPCEPGALRSLGRRARGSHRSEAMLRSSAVAAVALMLLGGLAWVYQGVPRAGADYGGISCQKVGEDLEQYVIGGLDTQTRQAIEEHLKHCPRCHQQMQSMQELSRLSQRLRGPSGSSIEEHDRENGWLAQTQ